MSFCISSFIIALLGLFTNFLIFSKFPLLPKVNKVDNKKIILSIIIPARNEEKNISLILEDLIKQNIHIHEIICVDDASTDKTKDIIKKFDVKLVTIDNKPNGWVGKNWACNLGAEYASGDVLLFLDADVRLKPGAISKLIVAYQSNNSVISVQPFHKTKKVYEQFSLFFNMSLVAGNGTTFIKQQKIGLFGPVIMISKEDYKKINGHSSVKSMIVEDMALGEVLMKNDIPFNVFLGDEDISFRMYSDGFKSLMQGWIKNFAIGSSKTPFFILFLVFLWVTSLAIVPLQIILYIVENNLIGIAIYIYLYLTWLVIISLIVKRIGKFKKRIIIIYPIFLIFFILIYLISIIKRVFKLNVIWKGRKINAGEGR